MASLIRPTEATYTINEKMTVNTTDREDHTFCGIMFPVECKAVLPVERIVITSLSVRGRLGPLSVYVSKDPDEVLREKESKKMLSASSSSLSNDARKRPAASMSKKSSSTTRRSNSSRAWPSVTKTRITATKSQWSKIYSKTHSPSFNEYIKLDLSSDPIVLRPGQVRGIYVHSTLPGDEAIVYDNYFGRTGMLSRREYYEDEERFRQGEVPEDSFMTIKPAMAHVSERPFGRTPIWGWGDAWRRDRKFVGRLEYGVVYRLWNPKEHLQFGKMFQTLVLTLFACQRRLESPFCRLPDECIYYILNMCKWDWMGDDTNAMQTAMSKNKEKRKEEEKQRLLIQTKVATKECADSACALVGDQEHSASDDDTDTKPSSIQKRIITDTTNSNVNQDDIVDAEDDEDDVWEDVEEEDDDDDDDWEDVEDDDDEENYTDTGNGYNDHVGAGAILYDEEDEDEGDADRRERIEHRRRAINLRARRTGRPMLLEDFISMVGAAVIMHTGEDDDENDGENANADEDEVGVELVS